MYVMVTQTCPSDKINISGERARELEKTPLPSYVERLYVFIRRDIKYGYISWVTYKIEKGKEEEGLQAISQRIGGSDNIEGFRCDMQVVYSVPEMLAAQSNS